MNIQKLETIAYAEGFIEDFVQEYIDSLDETTPKEILERAKQIHNMWQVIVAGVRDLRRENQTLENKITLVKNTLG